MGVQVVRDVDRQRILDRPVEEEEQPREGDQPEQVAPAEEAEARFGCVRVDRLLGRRSCGVRSPCLHAEERERCGVEGEQPPRVRFS